MPYKRILVVGIGLVCVGCPSSDARYPAGLDTLTYSSLITGMDLSGNPLVRIPGHKVLDVLTSAIDLTDLYPPCRVPVAERFDRQEIVAIKGIDTRSVQRRVLSVVNGREMLLRTKTSSRDFRAFAPSPGRIQ